MSEGARDGIAAASQGGVLTLRFDRPQKKNALTSAMYARLADLLGAPGPDIRAVAFLGAPGVFTAGNDIADFVAASGGAGGLDTSVLRFLKALAACDLPLVAGVDGPAIGVGTTMLFHCDHVLASPRALFRTPFVDLGLVPEAASSLLAPLLMGHARAFSLLVMGEPLDAEGARSAGLVNRVVPEEALEAETLAAAKAIAAKPREAIRLARRLLLGDRAAVLARIDEEAALFAERLSSPEAQAAFAAFMGKGRT